MFPVWPSSRCKIKEREKKNTNRPMKMPHPPTLETYFLRRTMSAAVVTDSWGEEGLFTFFFPSLFLHDVVLGLLSAIARMKLCDTA